VFSFFVKAGGGSVRGRSIRALPSTGSIGHCPPMTPSLTDALCTRCGLCCDGSLFADVELTGHAEATGLEILGLEIDDDDPPLLIQPCAALRGTRCGIYAHRPQCCRTFECRLLQEAQSGAVSVERAAERIAATLERIRHVKGLLFALETRRAGRPLLPLKERCAEALAGDTPSDHLAAGRRGELGAAMAGLEETIRTTFLGVSTRGRRGPGPRSDRRA
jgi:Fe-S-cluster containining protein